MNNKIGHDKSLKLTNLHALKINYKIMERRSGDIAECYANCDKANRELNWVAKYTVLDACRDSWNWQSKNPNGYED